MLAPYLPYLAEEVWHWCYASDSGMHDSVHRSPWPSLDEFAAAPGHVLLVDAPDSVQSYFWAGNLGVARKDPRRPALDCSCRPLQADRQTTGSTDRR